MLRDHRILNPALLRALASAGHTDLVVVADAGLPIPAGVPLIDLSLTPGVPSFAAVLETVLASLTVDEVVIAAQSADSPADATLKRLCADLPTRTVDHEELKALSRRAHVIVRTGECTPYANAVLVAGVTF